MNIRFVPRTDISIKKKSTSKYKPLLEAVKDLEPGGEALEVSYKDDKELNSMRNVVYAYNRESGKKVRSGKDSQNNRVFFYINENNN